MRAVRAELHHDFYFCNRFQDGFYTSFMILRNLRFG